jgi:hypothetical protein
MADDSVGRRMPFAFLAEVERRVSYALLYSFIQGSTLGVRNS